MKNICLTKEPSWQCRKCKKKPAEWIYMAAEKDNDMWLLCDDCIPKIPRNIENTPEGWWPVDEEDRMDNPGWL